ncbi:hypothetical protein EIP91_005660 [Steccherinum ochraceum]|uniref:ABM domain-containing protein n=1 Tax=Steccherinum ochraceum TaxID=92696 RepID=A0A4R0R6Y9_9APHY|nr:hypothetical protein EIP91_005660 [Steccherinum ochraceum]
MLPILLEYFKFTVSKDFTLASPAFAALRQAVKTSGGVKEQYYGLTDDEKKDLIWVVEWPGNVVPASFSSGTDLRQKINALDVNATPVSWLIPFRFPQEVRPALTAPVCEFAFVMIKDASDKDTIATSLHKTFTDCYYALADGFTGGNWGIAANNDRMHVYFLGFQSREHHAKYFASDLCKVEINALMPHYAAGSGAEFSKLTQELS